MEKPTWTNEADGWDYRLFSFGASAAGVPARIVSKSHAHDSGYHVPAGGALDLIIAGCAVSTIVAFFVRPFLGRKLG